MGVTADVVVAPTTDPVPTMDVGPTADDHGGR